MPEVSINLVDWNPDSSTLNTPGISEASNIFPTASGYQTSFQPVTAYQNLEDNAVVLSAFTAEFFDKSKSNFVSYKKSDGTFSIEIIGTNSNRTVIQDNVLQVLEGERPRFVQFGDSILCAHNGPLLIYTPISGEFEEITGAPSARYITVSDNFVIVANTIEQITDNPLKIQWSDLNDFNEWDASVTGSQAGEQVISGLGEIRNIIGSSQAVTILMDRGIVRGTYVGGDLKWTFTTIETENGCYVPDSVITVGNFVYFLAYEGFVRTNNISQGIQTIGQNRIDEYISENLDRSRLNEIYTTFNRELDTINWLIPTVRGKEIIHYNPKLNQWGRSDTNVDVIGVFRPVGETLDDLGDRSVDDPTLPNIDSSSYDGGGEELPVGFRGNQILAFDGEEGRSFLKTHEYYFPSNILVTGAEIIGLARNARVGVEYRDNLVDSPAVKESGLNNYNRAGLRANGKYFRFSVNTQGGLDASGLRIIYEPAGAR